MTLTPRFLHVAAFIAASAAVAVAQVSQVFRSTTEVVLVDVLVREGNRPVRNLTAADFIVYDSGAPQRIDQVSVEQLPIDLTLLLDTSGSTKAVAEQFRRGANRVAAMLGPDDRVRLMAFATEVAELSPLGRALPAPGATIQPPSGGTSLNDALLLTMARRTDPGRRHLIVTFTDGEDTTSVSQPVDVTSGARMSESLLHLVVPAESRVRPLNEAIEISGGAVTPLSGDAVDALKRIFDDLRQSYLLRYTPTWKSLPGWHSLSVRVAKSGVTVRARRGYYRP